MLTVDPDRLALGTGRRVLDLGCGGGRHAFAAWKQGASVVAVDQSVGELCAIQAMLGAMTESAEVVAPKGGVLAGDAYRLPFAASSFDVVIASEVLEHLHDDRAAMAELARVLRVDGVLAVSVPRTLPEALNWVLSRSYRTSPGGHIRIYRRRQIEQRLSAAGFRLDRVEYRHGLHSPYWWLRCAFGVDRPERRLVAAYHRLLVWEIERQPLLTQLLGSFLDPLIGKSVVLYLTLDRR